MVTITDVIKHAVRRQAETIHSIKLAAQKTEPEEKYVYVSPDGKTTSQHRVAGYTLTKVTGEKVIASISPKHQQWKDYRSAKRQASLLLTARLLLKVGDDCVPDVSVVNRALREGSLTKHASRRHSRSLARAARRYLHKLDNRLQRAPERFNDVEAWVRERQEQEAASVRKTA